MSEHHSGDMGPLADLSEEGGFSPSWTDETEDAAASAAAARIRTLIKVQEKAKAKVWDRYMQIAAEFGRISLAAMRRTGCNDRLHAGRAYNEEYSRLLRANKLDDNVATKQLRAALLNIYENREAVEAMRATWDANQRERWASPITVWDKFKGRVKAEAPRVPETVRSAGTSVSGGKKTLGLEDEVFRLQQKVTELERRVAHPFDDMDADEIADRLVQDVLPELRERIIERLTAQRDVLPGKRPQLTGESLWPLHAAPGRPAPRGDWEEPDTDEGEDA